MYVCVTDDVCALLATELHNSDHTVSQTTVQASMVLGVWMCCVYEFRASGGEGTQFY